MTDDELNGKFDQLANMVSRVAELTSSTIQQWATSESQQNDRIRLLVETEQHQNDRIRQLIDVQLATQTQIGTMSQQFGFLSQVVLEVREETRQLKAGYEQQQAILNELIRQRQPPKDP